METQAQQPDHDLWQLAKKRVKFKKHLITYLIVNVFLWLLWLSFESNDYSTIPWPLFPTLGWGIGLAFEYAGTYWLRDKFSVQMEYERLKKDKEKLNDK
jgi:hypothetical protein